MEALLAAGAAWPGAVAVSGGGDSISLMHHLEGWARRTGRPPPVVVTVDHGLRPDSAKAARAVSAAAKALRLKSHVLRWDGGKPLSDIEAAARAARYALIGAWARRHRIRAVYAGHTRDDLAETFLLRLGRGSGLDGLAAMRPHTAFPIAGYEDISLVRPLLAFDRTHLRRFLSGRNIGWSEDPMNEDDRFARARLRQLWPVLEQAGLSRARIADAADHLSRAREALDALTLALVTRAALPRGETVHLSVPALTAAPREIGLRALAHVLMAVSGEDYRPRFERLERLFDSITGQTMRGATLHGCKIALARRGAGAFGDRTIVLMREKPRGTARRS
jgi:tRNA(Ile)-lysidine synthase